MTSFVQQIRVNLLLHVRNRLALIYGYLFPTVFLLAFWALYPIEMAFSKLKHLLRKAAARTADTVCDAIGTILDTLTPQECRNFFAEAGYDRT
jgi:hypothetical protein